jgi:hypothetical protein
VGSPAVVFGTCQGHRSFPCLDVTQHQVPRSNPYRLFPCRFGAVKVRLEEQSFAERKRRSALFLHRNLEEHYSCKKGSLGYAAALVGCLWFLMEDAAWRKNQQTGNVREIVARYIDETKNWRPRTMRSKGIRCCSFLS